jgi:undecaprenyl-diphosphatase
MDRFVEWFLSISSIWAVAAVFLVPALETAVVLGLMLPGEITVFLGGVLAARGDVPLLAVLIAAVVGPATGDTIGYWLGRRYVEETVRRKLKKRWARAHQWLSRKGAWPTFWGRFLPFLRSVLPTAAGAMALSPTRFLSRDLPAAAMWGVASVFLGYFAARDFERALQSVHRFVLAIGGIAIIAVVLIIWRRTRSRRSPRGPSSVGGLDQAKRMMKRIFGAAAPLLFAVIGTSGIRADSGTAQGKLTVGGQETPLTYVYARAEKGFFDPAQEDIRVILSDVSLDDEALNDEFARNQLAQDGKLHSVEVVFNAKKEPISGVIRHPAFSRTQGFVSVSGMHRFEPKTFDGRRVEGKLSTDRPNEFMNVSFEYAAVFQTPVWRRPALTPTRSPRASRTPSRSVSWSLVTRDPSAIAETSAGDSAAG